MGNSTCTLYSQCALLACMHGMPFYWVVRSCPADLEDPPRFKIAVSTLRYIFKDNGVL